MVTTMKERGPNGSIGSSTGLIRSWDHGTYKVDLYRWGIDDTLLSSLKVRAANINNEVFDMDPIQTANEIRHHMKLGNTSASILIATSNDGEDLGFYIRREIRVLLGDGTYDKVSFTALREVRREYQRQGVGTALLVDGHEELAARFPIRYYTGRTQDEIIFESLIKGDLFDSMWPINKLRKKKLYEKGSDPQRIMWMVAQGAIYAETSPVDITKGLVYSAYPEGYRGGYVLDLSHPGVSKLHSTFEELGLGEEEKKKGHAIIYVARVKQPPVLDEAA